MRGLLTTLFLCLCTAMSAQDALRIHYKNGAHADIYLAEIDSLTFVKAGAGTTDVEATLTGSWLWGSREAGYYELLTFNDDHTYTGYDNYFTYGFDTQTYGWYSYYGAMLTLQSNGFGYQHRYNWFVTTLTGNALAVMTKTGPFTYYRLQPEVIHLSVGGPALPCTDGETIVFSDGVIVGNADNQLKGLVSGTTYILKNHTADNTILAYKVVVTG